MPPHDPTSADPADTCPLCGSAIPPGAPLGQCPRCLLGFGVGIGRGSGFGIFVETEDDDLLGAPQVRGFGDFELLEEIARGGMGIVYRARQISLGREVAVKMILAGELATGETVQRFRKEAAAAARLDHPNIVPVYEIGEHELQHFFSMRLVLGGRNVAGWATALDRAAGGDAHGAIATMMAKVANAVAFAHDRGVLHRDLKPSNILVDENGEPQITDFGLAKMIHEHEPDNVRTLSLAVMGSPSYMAPEQADGRLRDVTTATDVYGLGAVLYELLSGRPPFTGLSPLATARMVVDEMPAPLQGVPRDLATICMKCLAKEPGSRYATAHALAEDLERYSSGRSIMARPVTAPEAVWRWARRRPGISSLLAALALALVLGLGGVSWQWSRAEAARRHQQEVLEHLHWTGIVREIDTNAGPEALAKLATLLRAEPGNWPAAMLAMSVVDQQPFPCPAGPPVTLDGPPATAPRLAPDGSWFAAAGRDRIVRAWNAESGAEIARLPLDDAAKSLAVSGGPLALAVAMDGGPLLAWESAQASPVALPRGGKTALGFLKFSADGTHLLGHSAESAEVWSCAVPHVMPKVLTVEGGVRRAAISADGSRALVWNARHASLIEVASGRRLVEVHAKEEFGNGALAAGGQRFALADGRFTVRVWDAATNEARCEIDSSPSPVDLVTLDAAGSRVTLTVGGNELAMYETNSGVKTSPTMKHLYNPTVLVSSPDGSRMVSSGRDGQVIAWDAGTGEALCHPIRFDMVDRAADVDVSHDGKTVLTTQRARAGSPTVMTVWRSSVTRPPQRQVPGKVNEIAINRLSPDGKLACLSISPDFRAYVYELATGRVVLDEPTKGDVYGFHFSPDGARLYALTENGWLHGWTLATRQPLWPPVHHPGAIRPSAISRDGTRIIAGHNDGHIRISDTATGKLVQTLAHPGEVKVLRFAPDGSDRFLSGSTDGVAHVWNLHGGKKLASFTRHTDAIIAGSWSPDGRHVATASYDGTARVWDAATGRPIGQPMLHATWLAHLEYSPDGRLLATSCRDGTARLWDPLTGTPASRPMHQPSSAATVRFTADGKCLMVLDHTGFSFWDTARGERVSVHHPGNFSGMGFDAEGVRAIMSPDGRQVHLGAWMREGQLWAVPQPRGAVPPWFPDLLEGLALLHEQGNAMRVSDIGRILLLRQRLAASAATDEYSIWARRVLALPAITAEPGQ
ncbi:protein kinase [Luteolibacter flavescens]|uniref:Protein kinase n=1 Tax=Luteolibacter flavescens TaxID=1859460 RepID=A0ABT3FQH7_9BACT|nr:protein kinase [Luteolibacter flavescens]MCW1885486.1 protein kinase [Luteolibacter flavescens]